MELEFTEKELPQLAKKLLSNMPSKTLCFYGEMGAGKTTLIKAIVKELGGADPGSSPSFGLVNEYHKKDGSLLGYHFDFYRIEDEEEALDLGLEDYFYQDVWIFIEWPEKVARLLPEARVELHLKVLGTQKRELLINKQ